MGILLLLTTWFHYFDNLNEMSEFPVGRELSVKLIQTEIEILNSPMLNQNIEFIKKKKKKLSYKAHCKSFHWWIVSIFEEEHIPVLKKFFPKK